jgi:hypothetical protein
MVGTLRPLLFFVKFGTGTGRLARDLGPRRSKCWAEVPKNVNWPGGGGGGKVYASDVGSSLGEGAGSVAEAFKCVSFSTSPVECCDDESSVSGLLRSNLRLTKW